MDYQIYLNRMNIQNSLTIYDNNYYRINYNHYRINNNQKNIIYGFLFFYSILFIIISFKYLEDVKDNFILTLIFFFIFPLVPINLIKLYLYTQSITRENVYRNTHHNYEYNKYILAKLWNELIRKVLKRIHKHVKSEELCNICYTDNCLIKLNCSGNGFHGGCEDCLVNWTLKNNSCPICRKDII